VQHLVKLAPDKEPKVSRCETSLAKAKVTQRGLDCALTADTYAAAQACLDYPPDQPIFQIR
jgi:hypothetical protein